MSPITELVLQSTWETVVMVFFSTLFAILLGFPLSRVVLGTAIGNEATIIPLSIAADPFIARLTETALNEVDKGVIQVAVLATSRFVTATSGSVPT